MFRAGPDGRLTYVNEAYLRIQGLSRGGRSRRLVEPGVRDIRERVWADWQLVVRQHEPFHAERWLRRLDGASVHVACAATRSWSTGKVVGHVGTLIDLTDRASAEQALRTLMAIFDATTDHVVQTDTKGRMTYMNPAARRRSGLGLDEPNGHLSFTDSIHRRASRSTLEKSCRSRS